MVRFYLVTIDGSVWSWAYVDTPEEALAWAALESASWSAYFGILRKMDEVPDGHVNVSGTYLW